MRFSSIVLVLCLAGAQPALAQLEGMIDVHVHAAPDSTARSIDALGAARLAQRHGMRALLFKNHYAETASLAYLVAQTVPGVEVYGGIALNRAVGGINPVAVERMAAMTGGHGRVVWLPTFDSEHNHLTVTANANHVRIARDGALVPEVLEVLRVMRERDLALATGHSSPAETLLVVQAARAVGVGRVIVTHPTSRLVAMPLAMQKDVAALGAWLEYPLALALPGGEHTFEDFAAQIRELGPEHVIVSTDLGQVGNPVHTDGLLAFLPQFAAAGFTAAEIDLMTKHNPARFLGLD